MEFQKCQAFNYYSVGDYYIIYGTYLAECWNVLCRTLNRWITITPSAVANNLNDTWFRHTRLLFIYTILCTDNIYKLCRTTFSVLRIGTACELTATTWCFGMILGMARRIFIYRPCHPYHYYQQQQVTGLV